jgi:hypothetical protein
MIPVLRSITPRRCGVMLRAGETGTPTAPARYPATLERTMKQPFGLMMLAGALGLVPAGAAEGEFELAALQTPLGAGTMLPGRDDADRTLIKEDDCASPETIALIERNREDVERTVVMDR